MAEPVALDDTQDSEQTALEWDDVKAAREWADGVAATIGAIFKQNHPSGKDWA